MPTKRTRQNTTAAQKKGVLTPVEQEILGKILHPTIPLEREFFTRLSMAQAICRKLAERKYGRGTRRALLYEEEILPRLYPQALTSREEPAERPRCPKPGCHALLKPSKKAPVQLLDGYGVPYDYLEVYCCKCKEVSHVRAKFFDQPDRGAIRQKKSSD